MIPAFCSKDRWEGHWGGAQTGSDMVAPQHMTPNDDPIEAAVNRRIRILRHADRVKAVILSGKRILIRVGDIVLDVGRYRLVY